MLHQDAGKDPPYRQQTAYDIEAAQVLQSAWQLGVAPSSHHVPHKAYPQDAHNQRRQALAIKGALERAQLVQHAAQRPHVALAVVRPVLADLGGQVVRRADLWCGIIEKMEILESELILGQLQTALLP